MLIAMPPNPWSPMPRIALESVATIIRTSFTVTLSSISSTRSMSLVLTVKPRG